MTKQQRREQQRIIRRRRREIGSSLPRDIDVRSDGGIVEYVGPTRAWHRERSHRAEASRRKAGRG